MKTKWDVIVVGGGLAGLTAGATAAAGGADTVVLEAHQIGGRARTVTKDGFVFNMGAHAFYLGGPGAPILQDLGIKPDGVPSPFPDYRLVKEGKLHMMPSGPTSLIRTTAIGAASKAQVARLMGRLPTMRAANLAAVSVDEWIDDHDLRPDVAAIVRTLIRLSTYTADTAEFSADAAVRQLQIGARPGVLYLHGGWQQLFDGLAGRVPVKTGCKVAAISPNDFSVAVSTDSETLHARQVVVAPGTPPATRALLPADPRWPELGPAPTVACLDLGLSRFPSPGYALGVDEPVMAVVQSPPARQAPPGKAVVQAVRYGSTDALADRSALNAHAARIGVRDGDIETSRFLARMTVAGAFPRAATGGLAGRPRVTDSGHSRLYGAGDWIGPIGLLADAAIASGHTAARHALRNLDRTRKLVA